MNKEITWSIIDKYFNDNPESLISHHTESYNYFFNEGIQQIFKDNNPIRIMKEQDSKTNEFQLRCNLYLGGKNGDKIYYGKPMIYDPNREHYMYPNEARLRNMTYGITIHYDVDVEFIFLNNDGTDGSEQKSKSSKPKALDTDTEAESEESNPNQEIKIITLEKIFLGRFPIMLMSNLCILNGLDKKVRFEMGECKNDYGGYFIIDGKEKAIIPQETFANNMLYIRDKADDTYSHSAEIRSVSEDSSKPIRTLSIKITTPTPSYTNNQIVVNVPNVRKPVPLFILMRALGVESDKEIIQYCLLDIEKNSSYVDLFIPSIHDAGRIFTQEGAIQYIATFTKGHTIPHALEILTNYLLPHIGEMNFKDKAYFIGYMVKQLLSVYTKEIKATDRDNFKFKRVELTGHLMYDLFKEYYKVQQRQIYLNIDQTYYENQGLYNNKDGFINLINNNAKMIFSDRSVEKGFRKAFKGNWGSQSHTKRVGVVQDLNRLSYNSYISQLRKISLPLDASAKVVGPRLAHTSQWGIIDPVDTPDGGNAGLHKHLAITTHITTGSSSLPMIKWLMNNDLIILSECIPTYISNLCKVIVNGNWIGVIHDPKGVVALIKKQRRISLIPIFISVEWNISSNTLFIYTDSGRLCRPIYYINNGKPSYANKAILENISNNKFSWENLITGFAQKKDKNFSIKSYKVYYSVSELYNATTIKEVEASSAIIDYIDTSETESALIAMTADQIKDIRDKDKKDETDKMYYTHVEIDPSLMLGVMGNQIVFPENNQLPRDLFACGQAKQAVSLYHTNFHNRMDKMGVVLNNGQVPIVKSRYLKYINQEEHPCGENTIVAIMAWNGYNVEDSILFNEGSLKRGLFRTTYYTTYESREESSKVGNTQTDSRFANIEQSAVIGLKPGYDYSELDQFGIIKENTLIDDKKALIGKIVSNPENPEVSIDDSTFPKKGQIGYVDKTFITEGEEGFRIAKVKLRDQRVPAIGDKFCSRCGQKGTVGLIIPEEDMPFTENGLRPDIIINPHAIPSRMTIGQLIETIMGKACTTYGAFGDCTAFVNSGTKHKVFGDILTREGFHSSGSEILYNGQTGEQLQSDIFIGPTYYMRLKHMVKDKINYRALGPRTALTRQTVQGRANDGGLRIGEMERDGLIAHGITKFLKESMLVRGDDYYMAVCNTTGMIAIYNNSRDLFMSPSADGPIKYNNLLDDKMNIKKITKYGRTFSILRIPYSFKLLIQELQAMNVQLRIITDDNIDQIANMTFLNKEKVMENNKLSGKMTELINKLQIEQNKTSNPATTKNKSNAPRPEKLISLGFIKFKVPAFTINEPTILPINTPTTEITSNIELDNEFTDIHKKVNSYKEKLDNIPDPSFIKLSSSLNLYSGLKTKFNEKGFPFATNASFKMYELIQEMNLIDCSSPIKAFCNAELPGAFIVTINHYIKTICANTTASTNFDWVGSSYYPEAAAKEGDMTIIGDTYGIYKNNRTNWLMGPRPNAMHENAPDITGDVTDSNVIDLLSTAIHTRFNTTNGATLATSDAGIDVSEDYSNQEKDTALINYGQIITAIFSLAIGGHMVTKQYTFSTPFNRSLIALVSLLFDETYIVKPATSRPANSEVYIVGKKFKGISINMKNQLLERMNIYSSGLSPMDGPPLFNPRDYASIDKEILEATKLIHGEQQVLFLNEMSTLYNDHFHNINYNAISKVQINKWLQNYPLSIINTEDTLNWKNNPAKQPLLITNFTETINDTVSNISNLLSSSTADQSAIADQLTGGGPITIDDEVTTATDEQIQTTSPIEYNASELSLLTNIESNDNQHNNQHNNDMGDDNNVTNINSDNIIKKIII